MNSMYNGFGLRLSWNNLAYKTQKAYSLFKTRVPQEQKERTREFVKMSGDIKIWIKRQFNLSSNMSVIRYLHRHVTFG